MLLFKDLIKLFASYNDGIINLLGKEEYIRHQASGPLFLPTHASIKDITILKHKINSSSCKNIMC